MRNGCQVDLHYRTHIFFLNFCVSNLDMLILMVLRPCPVCRKPTAWEANPSKPFCSERCRLKDLGAWASEDYRVAGKPEEENGEGWTGEGEGD